MESVTRHRGLAFFAAVVAAGVVALAARPVAGRDPAVSGPSGALPGPGLTIASDDLARTAGHLGLPALPDGAAAWIAPGFGRHVIDDFEAAPWPDAARWPLVVDLTSAAGSDVVWAPRDCRAAAGARSLWSVGGGSMGTAAPCGSDAPGGLQSSAILALDLTALRGAARLELLTDLWSDAGPSEGLLVNAVDFGPDGVARERRIVFSATGRSVDWSREVAIDLTALRDRLDPSWTGDLRGQVAYLEFLFVSDAGAAEPGSGIFVDNVGLRAEAPTPVVVTPVPPPTATPTATPAATQEVERTEACTTEPDCRTLQVWSYVDYRCDRRFQPGVDERVRSKPRVDITAGSELLGTRLDARGYATFRLPSANGAIVTLDMPEGYEACPNSGAPWVLEARDFSRFGLTTLELRLQRSR